MNTLHQHTGQMILENIETLAQAAVDRQYEAQPEIWKRYQKIGYAKSLQDAVHNFSFLAHALDVDHPNLYLDYVAWLKVLFASLKFRDDALINTLDWMRLPLQQKLPPELAALACSYLDLAIEKTPDMPDTVESFLQPHLPLHDLAVMYHQALLKGDRRAASQTILEAVKDGTDIKEIYLNVFQLSQSEIGRLWQLNRVTVAHEHFHTAATQTIMSQLYPYIFASSKNGHNLVATSVGGELHEMGMRMVADFLEMDGWDTYYLGANTPTTSVLSAIQERGAELAAISVTLSSHLGNVKTLIERIKSECGETIKVIVGGYPFNIDPQLWKTMGADGFAHNAQDTLSLATQLVTNA